MASTIVKDNSTKNFDFNESIPFFIFMYLELKPTLLGFRHSRRTLFWIFRLLCLTMVRKEIGGADLKTY